MAPCVAQERRTFIPQGWTKFYEFTFADLRSAADVIALAVKDNRPPQWPYLHGLLEMAIYGGRIDNDADAKVGALWCASWQRCANMMEEARSAGQ
jgi:dynein heavy chain 2